MLPYHAYYDALAEIGTTPNEEWKLTTAGLVVLRLVNDWLDFPDIRARTDDASIAAARYLISEISPTKKLRPYLTRIIRALERADDLSLSSIERPVASYAETLSRNGRFALANDALQPLLVHAQKSHDTRALARITGKLGLMARSMGRADESMEYYERSLGYAKSVGDPHSEWIAVAGLNKLAFARGDFPTVESSLSRMTRIAKNACDLSLEWLTIHDRAFVADTSGNAQEAVRLLEAVAPIAHLLPCDDVEVMEGDLASSLILVDRVEESKRRNLVLAKSARTQIARWGALHHLMYIGMLENDFSTFDFYRKTLEFAPLHAWAAVLYRFYAAQGLRHFGNVVGADQELAKAKSLANSYGIKGWHLR